MLPELRSGKMKILASPSPPIPELCAPRSRGLGRHRAEARRPQSGGAPGRGGSSRLPGPPLPGGGRRSLGRKRQHGHSRPTSRSARAFSAVASAISASWAGLGCGAMAQSAKRQAPSAPMFSCGETIRKKLEPREASCFSDQITFYRILATRESAGARAMRRTGMTQAPSCKEISV